MFKIKRTDRIGETKINKWDNIMTIVEYINSHDINVEFESGYETKTTYDYFKKGNIKSPYYKSVLNKGFIGEGQFKVSSNGIHSKEYSHWFNMFNRCYDEKIHIIRETYKNCTVCEEWYNFQTFAKWYTENYYEIDEKKMHLDKDILHKGNKIYSPENCVFVPININSLFTKRETLRGICPIGVTYHKRDDVFQSRCNDGNGKSEYLGCFGSPQLAFNAYKIYKEKHIKEVADKFRNQIPNKLYEAMYSYKVEITD